MSKKLSKRVYNVNMTCRIDMNHKSLLEILAKKNNTKSTTVLNEFLDFCYKNNLVEMYFNHKFSSDIPNDVEKSLISIRTTSDELLAQVNKLLILKKFVKLFE